MIRVVVGSPLGKLDICLDSSKILRRIDFADADIPLSSAVAVSRNFVARQLKEFFSGKRTVFEIDYQLDGTDFQQLVWQQIAGIPFGETVTYGDIARAIGKPQSSRAVGAACGRNPISIVVPCHRVVGAGNKLTGYDGGLDRKAWLLSFERQQTDGT